jgi:hypothetical protein
MSKQGFEFWIAVVAAWFIGFVMAMAFVVFSGHIK